MATSDRNEFTGRVVLTVEIEAIDLDVNATEANLEALIASRLDLWSERVGSYTVSTELYSS